MSNDKDLLTRNSGDISSLSGSNGTRTHNHLVRKRTLNHLAKLTKWLSWVASSYLYGVFDCMLLSCHVRVSAWIHNICSLDFKEHLSRNRRNIWSLSDCNRIWSHNHLVCKRTLTRLAKLTNWLSWVVSTYLYAAVDCMFLSCHVRVSQYIYTLFLPECQGTPSSKKGQYLKF